MAQPPKTAAAQVSSGERLEQFERFERLEPTL
jgi:hypothetical protein